MYKTYGTISLEAAYAHERMKKLGGIEPYAGRPDGMVRDVFARAMKQASKDKKKVALFLNSGVIRGMFVVAPDPKSDDPAYCSAKFEECMKNQQTARWDKPIDQQKAEEKGASGPRRWWSRLAHTSRH